MAQRRMHINDDNPYTLQGLDEYLRQAAPSVKERGEAWRAAIGLQEVDGLQPSPYLIQTAFMHIKGEISIKEAKERIDDYYRKAKDKAVQSANNTVQSARDNVQSANAATQKEMAMEIGKSERTVKSITVKLQEAGILKRVGGKRNGRWELVL
ncbi:MAG: antitoxin VbhA family protein [Prevotellaceae bacterium]|nr:antitoxin VbhA family protein [Prevotellaceae bacterium]